MGIKLVKTREFFFVFIMLIILLTPRIIWAKGGFEFYFLGVNLRTFQGSDWVKVGAGAVASVLVHELGHALYLESQGKDWRLRASFSSGFAVNTYDSLSDKQYRGFGRSGFLLQSGIGVLLTTFEETKSSDFTKGWVGMNAIQVLSYKLRNHDIGDDFATIERGRGNGDSEFRLFSSIGMYNFLKVNSPTDRTSYSVEGLHDSQRPLIFKHPKEKYSHERSELTLPFGTEIVPRKSSNLLPKNMTEWGWNSRYDSISITDGEPRFVQTKERRTKIPEYESLERPHSELFLSSYFHGLQ